MAIDLNKYQPSCVLAHGLINKLSVIVGDCDLISEQWVEPEPELFARLQVIREVAQSAARELRQHQCELEAMSRIIKNNAESLKQIPVKH